MPNRPLLAPGRPLATGFVIVLMAAGMGRADGPEATGEQVYKRKCASCHGANGEGSEDCDRALMGNRSMAGLKKLIEKTMPEDDPGTCVGPEAERVASYLYDRFYSGDAQARNKPPRIELSRLTVRQYRNAVADLIGGFRDGGTADDRRGLKASYYKAANFRRNDLVVEKVDPRVRFDFGLEGPEPEKYDPARFSIFWEGSVFAPETGDYEFLVKTDHATRLWVNEVGQKRPLVDAWVKSGDDTEFRGSIHLLGGRWYPLRLDFSKGKQGVDDSKDKKKAPKPVRASISLEWKLPLRPAEVIPERHLSPGRPMPTFVPETPFPPDDRSTGYERGTTISRAWEQATTDAAIETAVYVSSHLKELANTREDAPDRAEKLREFARQFAKRAFRRPLTDEQKQFFIDNQFADGRDPVVALKRVILLVLQSPRFLYREVGREKPDAYDVASRLSFALWDSLPDQTLLEAASKGELSTREQVTAQAERMVGDVRARSKLREFFQRWLRVEQVPDLAKDAKEFPGFDAEVASDLRTSLDLFLDDVIWGESSDFRQLLKADYVFLNGRLASFYGADLPHDAPFVKFPLDAGERSGLLSHPYLMATFAYTSATSPIHRGVFLSRSVLGRSLRPPPEAVAPLAPDLHASLTTRERVALQTSPTACITCHGMINPLGFGLEHFDAVGRYRPQEKEKPIDATGSIDFPSGETKKYAGARELGELLAASDETHAAFVEQLFHHLVKQPIRAFGARKSQELRKTFAEKKYSIRRLMVEIAADTVLQGG